MARGIRLPIQERSAIRKVDRFLGNRYFQDNAAVFYAGIIARVVGQCPAPEIIIDWTKLPNVDVMALRASFAARGRAITLYEEVHPRERSHHPGVHRLFLQRLQQLLPAHCCPVIVTDAGFQNSWFKLVRQLTWNYVGRVRGIIKYDAGDGAGFQECRKLQALATRKPRSLGAMILSKGTPLRHFFYLAQHTVRGRKNRYKDGRVSQHPDSLKYSRGYREPWLLVSSLHGAGAAEKIVAIYKRRMTIEEAFRDLKSTQYGLSMRQNITLKHPRLIVWLMIAALTSLFVWIVGYLSEQKKLHYQFQANSIKTRRVLSLFYLGCQVLRKQLFSTLDLANIHAEIFNHV